MEKTSAKVIFPELSYKINGLLFEIHNTLGQYAREKQYGDALQTLLENEKVAFEREKFLPIELVSNISTNKADFVIENQIVLELKAKPFVTDEDFVQIRRYLQAGNYKLGLVVNFRSRYLKPKRIIRSHS